jgi:hypothetical protein
MLDRNRNERNNTFVFKRWAKLARLSHLIALIVPPFTAGGHAELEWEHTWIAPKGTVSAESSATSTNSLLMSTHAQTLSIARKIQLARLQAGKTTPARPSSIRRFLQSNPWDRRAGIADAICSCPEGELAFS